MSLVYWLSILLCQRILTPLVDKIKPRSNDPDLTWITSAGWVALVCGCGAFLLIAEEKSISSATRRRANEPFGRDESREHGGSNAISQAFHGLGQPNEKANTRTKQGRQKFHNFNKTISNLNVIYWCFQRLTDDNQPKTMTNVMCELG